MQNTHYQSITVNQCQFLRQFYSLFGINYLKIAQRYAPEDPNVAVLLKVLEKILKIMNTPKKDYYKVLGVSRTLSMDEIKRAFRRKSLRHHPGETSYCNLSKMSIWPFLCVLSDKHFTASDKIQQNETKIFQEIREAYETLSDPMKRSAYDEKLERDQEALVEYKKVFKNAFISFDSEYLSSIVWNELANKVYSAKLKFLLTQFY